MSGISYLVKCLATVIIMGSEAFADAFGGILMKSRFFSITPTLMMRVNTAADAR